MKRRNMLLVIVALAACRTSAGPPAAEVKKAAESLFARAARGEEVPAIRFTGQGTAEPKLISSEITARRRISSGQGFEYDVRLTYLNRIRQLEWATVRLPFEKQGEGWRQIE